MKRALRLAASALAGVGAACVGIAPPQEAPICVLVPVEGPPDPPPRRAPPGVQPLEAATPFVDLEVAGHEPAIVSLPLGATGPRPLVVAAHGAGDRAEHQCAFWRNIVGDRAFVLCPRGYPMNPHTAPDKTGYFFPTHLALGAEVESAISALLVRYRPHVDAAAPIFAGFSQGAAMGAALLPSHPARFARAVLIEGGAGAFEEWTRGGARRFRQRGGARLLFACGSGECASAAEASARGLEREGIATQVAHAPGAGHLYGGAVGDEVARAFSWLIEGDERFAPAPP